MTTLRGDLPRGDFAKLPAWWQEAVRSLCWSDAAFKLAPADDYRFGLFADDLQSCAAILFVAGTAEADAWRALCNRVPEAARLACAVAPKSPPRARPVAALPVARTIKPAAWRDSAGIPWCDHGYVSRVPAGTSYKTGYPKPYRAFWACPARICRIPDAALDPPANPPRNAENPRGGGGLGSKASHPGPVAGARLLPPGSS